MGEHIRLFGVKADARAIDPVAEQKLAQTRMIRMRQRKARNQDCVCTADGGCHRGVDVIVVAAALRALVTKIQPPRPGTEYRARTTILFSPRGRRFTLGRKSTLAIPRACGRLGRGYSGKHGQDFNFCTRLHCMCNRGTQRHDGVVQMRRNADHPAGEACARRIARALNS